MRLPAGFDPQPSDVFAFAARTGGFNQTLYLDNIVVEPTTLRPASNLTARRLPASNGNVIVTEVKWDTDPGGIYDLYVSTDLTNWFYSRSYTPTGSTQAITSIGSVLEFPRYYFRVTRQQ